MLPKSGAAPSLRSAARFDGLCSAAPVFPTCHAFAGDGWDGHMVGCFRDFPAAQLLFWHDSRGQ